MINFSRLSLRKADIEHREPIIVGFFILQYAELRMFEFYYNFFTKLCDADQYKTEIVTGSLYFALAENELYECIRIEKRREWELLLNKYCSDSFTADACIYFFPQ